jgi:hypothetical protein
MTVARAAVRATACACVATACAAPPPIAAGVPRIVDGLTIAPYETHEACVSMQAGERLDWRYESTTPLSFEIHYREGNAVLAPVVRADTAADSGTFEARLRENYCAFWEAGRSGAIVSYRMLLRPPNR